MTGDRGNVCILALMVASGRATVIGLRLGSRGRGNVAALLALASAVDGIVLSGASGLRLQSTRSVLSPLIVCDQQHDSRPWRRTCSCRR